MNEVPADVVLDSTTGFRVLPLHPLRYGNDALHSTVPGGHRAQPTTITTPTLWEHLVRFNKRRVGQGKTVLL